MIRILIVDDHPIFRQGLIRIITNNADMTVTGEAVDGNDALNKIKTNEYDLVLLDISMPGKDGLDVIKEIKNLYPKISVLVLTMHPENQYAMRMFKSGASGYLTKERAPEELIDAIRIVSGGGKYISPSMTANIITEWGRNTDRPPHEYLSDREYQIMCMIAAGKKVSQIAAELSLSVKTVKTHRSRILMKMKMSSNAELIHYAVKKGLVSEIIPTP